MNKKSTAKLISILLIITTIQANTCTFQLPTRPYLTGINLTSNDNIILSMVKYPDSTSGKEVALDLKTKTIKEIANETIFNPEGDVQQKYLINYTYDLINSTYYNITINLFNEKEINIFNSSIEIFGLNSTMPANYWTINTLNSQIEPLLVSRMYNRFYFYNNLFENHPLQSVPMTNPVNDVYNITKNILGPFGITDIFDNQSIIYYSISYGTNCEGYYYYAYNESMIWKVDSSVSYELKVAILNTNTNSFYEIWGTDNEVKIMNLNGNVAYDWKIDQNQIDNQNNTIPIIDQMLAGLVVLGIFSLIALVVIRKVIKK